MLRKPAASALFIAALVMLGGAAHAQSDSQDKTMDRAGKIASQPVRDVGISKDKIPPVLQSAFDNPYARPGRRCPALVAELVSLNDALGPDFDEPPVKGDDKATRIAEAGGEMLVNSLIPFRGLVREVSGAASADRRKLAAVNAGLARRGYLRGIAADRNCKIPRTPPKAPVKASQE